MGVTTVKTVLPSGGFRKTIQFFKAAFKINLFTVSFVTLQQ